MKENLTPNNIGKAQHAYFKGRSVETVLHEVAGQVEKSHHLKECAVAAFLDEEDVFNNV